MTKKSDNNAETEAEVKTPAQGRAIILPNGERRIDYIKRRFFEDGVKRGDIARELTEMTGATVPYQIVFAATKKPKAVEGEAAAEDNGSEEAPAA